ncbi:DNA polymerase III subunit delta' [soil metagenome]
MTAVFRTRGHAAAAVVERAVRSERPPHALLLVGPARVGKTTLALDLACGLLCLRPEPSERPCRECSACRKVDHGNHPDLHRLAPEGAGQQIRLGQVQALTAELALMPAEGRFRLAIIEQAHRLNQDAQNALLKTLEEPHPKVVLILAADESASLLPTVVSRCARLRLGPVAAEVITDMLAEAEVADASRGARLARLAGGCPGRALAIAAQPEVLVAQDRLARRLLALLGGDRRERLAALDELLEDAAGLVLTDEAAETPAERPARRSRAASSRAAPAERRLAAAQLLSIWRDVTRDLALAAHGAVSELRLRELADDMLDAGSTVSGPALAQFLARLDDAGRAVDAYANPELVLDVLLLKWPRSGRAA